jgi:hypothetical protein
VGLDHRCGDRHSDSSASRGGPRPTGAASGRGSRIWSQESRSVPGASDRRRSPCVLEPRWSEWASSVEVRQEMGACPRRLVGGSLSAIEVGILSPWHLQQRSGCALDVLVCSHCHSRFRASPAAVGEVIRCRACNDLFSPPRPTASVAPGPDAGKHTKPTPPIVSDLRSAHGRLSGACPICNHVFSMPRGVSGAPIRCRGCRSLIVVKGKQVVGEVAPGPPESNSRLGQSSDQGLCGLGERASSPVMGQRTLVHDDIDDAPAKELQAESSAPVMRRPGSVSRRRSSGVVSVLIPVILGGVCALPIAQGILWWFFRHDPLRIVDTLPPRVRWIAPSELSR